MRSRKSGLLGRIMRMKWAVSIMLIAVMVPMMTGCYGNFKMTRSVYGFNGNIESRLGEQFVFWGLTIIPVYGLAALGDIVVFNTIEFWTGQELDVDVSAAPMPEGTEVVAEPTSDGSAGTLAQL